MGNSKISMVTSLIMNAVNIAGNAILVFIFHMGVAGVALPSLISRVLGALMLLVPVSYTHLDVYKRQPGSSGTLKAGCPPMA